ncbi:hypothetical protein [Microbacterium sp. SLBN-146]|uniref:hypothetical protein n=1 Tax=Microbacterium sp. SLBN-146 TaxID=2768457 RepID=UPI0011714B6C|nr:hypothetical protein [Microbacterium sp. SLBN-146]TQJ30744.1 hypothetical protein FBY39_1201 [Microbacterium sp. SLBN-146]
MADTADPTALLQAKIEELEAENARLLETTRRPPSRGRWRAVLSALVIVIAAILVPVSIAAAWARVQLVEEDAFVQTLAPLVDDPAVQGLVIDEAMDGIRAQVDFDALTAEAIDGISELGLGPRASAALRLLEAPIASGLDGLVERTVTTVVESDAFSDVWATAVRGAHRALTLASTSDGGGIVVLTADGAGISLGPIVDEVKQRLVDQGVGVAELIPAVDRVVIIGSGETLTTIRTSYALASAVGWWLPVLTLGLFALGIALARRRSTAVLGTGAGFAIGGATLAVTLSVGAAAMTMVAGNLDLSPSALDVIYRQLVGDMAQTAWVIALLGVVIALTGWLMGRSRAAMRTRATVESLNDSARGQLAERGLDTGGFGRWLGRNRILVRVLIAVLAVLWLFALRPLGFGDVVLVVITSLIAGFVLEFLQVRSDDAPTPVESGQ